MAKFFFRAKNKLGEVSEGVIDAASSDAAVDVLQKNQLFPIVLREEKKDTSLLRILQSYWDRVDSKELMMFFRQLSILIEAKVPITSSLHAIKEQTDNVHFQQIIEEMANDIQDGLALSDALKKHRDVFSVMSINIIRAGEVSGNLRKAVAYVADNIEKNYAMTSKVKSAMMYPMIVLFVFFVIGFIVISFIVPKLTVMIKSMGADIPWYTRGLIFTSDFMNAWWWAVAIVIIGFIGGLVYYLKTEDGKKEMDQIKLKLPIFGKVFQHVYIARFADNLGVLLVGGIPIIKALNVVSSVIGNTVYEAIFLKAADEVKVGGNMSDALRRYPQIPPIVAQMVRIGEESGQIDLVLGHIARFYEQETDEATKNLATLIEPVLMVIIGIAVGFLAFSIIMPIYNIAGQI
ncbi:MAG: type II secretion system F family protein [Parcubacteria group bacterium]|jgi:type IV pilus assembly protein PilC